ncbi:DUF3653 domain-containing protein [Enterovibrio norvegicus]|uniref:DUF3653 domain-containing protein n=1 Tax=Enterovibrio norvegicus TaxID=188144 RepID=UPI00280B15FB|nr:DUF3653 domain-containing protein [Enterovibrio norvegicus]
MRWLKPFFIKVRGYLLNALSWQGFRVSEHRAVIITPDGQEFNPVSLMASHYGETNIMRCVSVTA